MKGISILLFTGLLIFAGNVFGGDKPQEKKQPDKRALEEKIKYGITGLEWKIETAPEEVITELDGIIKTCIQQGYNEALAHAYLLMGRAYKEINQPNLALHFLNEAYTSFTSPERFKEKNEENDIPDRFYLDFAETQSMTGNYGASNTNYYKYLSGNKDPETKIKVNYAIADNYYRSGEIDQAIESYKQLLAEEQQRGNENGVSTCNARLAACYILKGKTEIGIEFYSNSISGINSSQLDDVQQLSENKEVVSKALRSQKKYKEEVQVLSGGPDAQKDALANLRLAQSYYATAEYKQAESALDNYFSEISYDLIDVSEIKVIKDIALRLQQERKYQKALDYLLNYENILDSIKGKLDYLESRSEKIGVSGYQNLLQIETLQKDKEITENMLNHLMKEGELKAQVVSSQKYLIYLLSLIVVFSIGTMIYILRVSKQRRLANQQLALRSLRSQMNPHFIFNALNSVNSFISVSDERSANKFLSDFSKLMRTVMENSEHDLIPLSKELEIIKIYLELENFRFKDKFSFDIRIDPDLDEESYNLPPMLLQPYIENAIWHGLRYKEEKGELIVKISGDIKTLYIEIQDNGIGRTASKELKTKNQQKSKSTALRNISERIKIFNDLHKVKIEVAIADLNNDQTGTAVKLKIPQTR